MLRSLSSTKKLKIVTVQSSRELVENIGKWCIASDDSLAGLLRSVMPGYEPRTSCFTDWCHLAHRVCHGWRHDNELLQSKHIFNWDNFRSGGLMEISLQGQFISNDLRDIFFKNSLLQKCSFEKSTSNGGQNFPKLEVKWSEEGRIGGGERRGRKFRTAARESGTGWNILAQDFSILLLRMLRSTRKKVLISFCKNEKKIRQALIWMNKRSLEPRSCNPTSRWCQLNSHRETFTRI